MNRRAEPGSDITSFATPILINMLNRPVRLADSLAELSQAAGRVLVAHDGSDAAAPGGHGGDTPADVQLIRPRRFEDRGGFVNRGFRSNLDAHLQAARLAKSSGVERALILEDDLSFSSAWSSYGAALLDDLDHRDWHLASLGYLDVWKEAPGLDTDLPYGWVRFSGRVNGAQAYFLHHRAFDWWIDHLEAIAVGVPGDDLQGPMASDGAINTFAWTRPEVIRLLAVPNMVGTRPTRSDITPGTLDRLPVVGDLVERLRIIRRRRSGASTTNFD